MRRRHPVIPSLRMSFAKTISVALLPLLLTALMILERSVIETVSVLRRIKPSKLDFRNVAPALQLIMEAQRFRRAALGLFRSREK